MSASLPEIQARQQDHFTSLSHLRAGGAPVFALEHDLDQTELALVASALRAQVAGNRDLEPHWLLWVIYAAELGYRFDGDEYWQSFEQRTPRWDVFGSRNTVRTWFRRFQKRFGGVEPSGPWAEHRTIISWPITNAILPKDLQFQFARALHYARHSLAAAGSGDSKHLGRLIRREAWHFNSRFQQFVQQEALVGRLTLAILGAEEAEGDRILRSGTLKRVVSDLESTRQAKDWLDGTRGAVSRFKGTNRLPSMGNGVVRGEARRDIAIRHPNLRPTLTLSRSALNQWDVFAEIPSFADLANQSEELRTFLSKTRSTVAGSGGAMRPSSWLLGNGRARRLVRWPDEGAPIVLFEKPNPHLDNLLRSEGTFSKGPVWPCRVRDDGTATEIVGRQVRPNQTYILIHSGSLTGFESPLLTACNVTCEGLKAVQLKVPAAVSEAQEAFIARLGLELCRTVRLWPVGLAARGWDGEGSGEWLTTERPTFGIVHDHPVGTYAVSLNGGAETVVDAGQPGQAIFITLPELDAGNHVLKVRALGAPRNGAPPGKQKQVEGLVALAVREPAAWVPGTTAHGGLAVSVEPGRPDLDDLISNRLHLQIYGPEDRQIEVGLKTIVPPSDGWVARQKFKLPRTVTDWTSLIGAVADEELSIASRAQLVIFGDELGELRIDLEREAAPLRWACKRGAITSLRMIDEGGADVPPTVTLLPFASPISPITLDPDICRASFPVDPPGGLFLVSGPGGQDAIIVSVRPAGGHLGLQDLGLTPSMTRSDGLAARPSEILDGTKLWSRARAIGPLAATRKSVIVTALEELFFADLCGPRWIAAERLFRASQDMQALGENVGSSSDARSFSAVLRRGRPDLLAANGLQRAGWFADVAGRYNICGDPVLSELAVRLATDPSAARLHYGEAFDAEVSKLATFGTLARGARLSALLPDIGAWRW